MRALLSCLMYAPKGRAVLSRPSSARVLIEPIIAHHRSQENTAPESAHRPVPFAPVRPKPPAAPMRDQTNDNGKKRNGTEPNWHSSKIAVSSRSLPRALQQPATTIIAVAFLTLPLFIWLHRYLLSILQISGYQFLLIDSTRLHPYSVQQTKRVGKWEFRKEPRMRHTKRMPNSR